MEKCIAQAILIALLLAGAAHAEPIATWRYAGDTGPAHWASLSAEFVACSQGKNQSPVDLAGMIDGSLPPMSLDYRPGGVRVINNGHTIQVDYAPGSTLALAGHRWTLRQFHFHAPSEHQLRGHAYPMEGHFVHADEDGNLAVVAVFYELGNTHPGLAEVWRFMPHWGGASYELLDVVDARELLPQQLDYYRFNGSLTTPPCTEGVTWLVNKQRLTLSDDQLRKFQAAIHHPNNRPLQPINARVILE